MSVGIIDFPDNLIESIALFLPSFSSFFSVCKRFHSISKSERFWQVKLKADFSREKPKKGLSFQQQFQREFLLKLSDKYVTQAHKVTPGVVIFDEVEFISRIGTTRNNMLFSGIYQCEKSIIKVMKSKKTNREDTIEKMSSIWQSRHFVQVIGFCSFPKFYTIQEYCALGNLEELLSDSKTSMNWNRFFELSIDIVSSICSLYLSDPPISHKEIRLSSFMVTEDWQAKLDFDFPSEGSCLKSINETQPSPGTRAEKRDSHSITIMLWQLATKTVTGRLQPLYKSNMDEKRSMDNFPTVLSDFLNKSLRCKLDLKYPAKTILMEILFLEQQYKENRVEWNSYLKKK